jgi:4-hydroxybenzoyl-CoA thioesterase
MLTNSRTLRIEWSDCDPAGIVFYPRFFSMFDTSTTMLFEKALGMTGAEIYRHYNVIGYPIVGIEARFLFPIGYRDEVTIETTVADIRRSSFDMRHSLLKAGALAVEALEKRVWAAKHPDDPARIKSQPLPQDIVAKLSA